MCSVSCTVTLPTILTLRYFAQIHRLHTLCIWNSTVRNVGLLLWNDKLLRETFLVDICCFLRNYIESYILLFFFVLLSILVHQLAVLHFLVLHFQRPHAYSLPDALSLYGSWASFYYCLWAMFRGHCADCGYKPPTLDSGVLPQPQSQSQFLNFGGESAICAGWSTLPQGPNLSHTSMIHQAYTWCQYV